MNNNDPVSKMPPQFYKQQIIVLGFTLMAPLTVTLLFYIDYIRNIERDIAFQFGVLVSLWGMYIFFVGLSKYLIIVAKHVNFEEDGLILIVKNRNIKIDYKEIECIEFSLFSYDKSGAPYPRWMVNWRKGMVARLISFTEENALELAKRLDSKEIPYQWEEFRREEWEEQLKKKGLVIPSK